MANAAGLNPAAFGLTGSSPVESTMPRYPLWLLSTRNGNRTHGGSNPSRGTDDRRKRVGASLLSGPPSSRRWRVDRLRKRFEISGDSELSSILLRGGAAVARLAHNQEDAGSIPAPAIHEGSDSVKTLADAVVAQLARVPRCHRGGCGFESRLPHLTVNKVVSNIV
jgi:hypothetical protein